MSEVKRGRGRPSDYRPEYCAALIDHMKQGLSFESFAATIGKDRDTLYQWTHTHLEFSDAKKKGAEHSLLFWEKVGITGMMGKLKGFQTAPWIFSMKNRFGWRDTPPDLPPSGTSELAEALNELDSEEGGKPKSAPKKVKKKKK